MGRRRTEPASTTAPGRSTRAPTCPRRMRTRSSTRSTLASATSSGRSSTPGRPIRASARSARRPRRRHATCPCTRGRRAGSGSTATRFNIVLSVESSSWGAASISETSEQRAILFADVCESTSIYEKLGDAKALALINALFKALDKEVNGNGGVIVKTLGDGMVCQFREPDAAFRAACGMQEATARVDAKDKGGLKLKIGYTYGPVVIKDRDVFGDTVNVCARLVSLANPQQVLTTRETINSLSDELRSRCRDLYATKVRGRQREVMVCEVLWRADPDKTRVNDFSTDTSPKAAWTYVLKLTLAGETYVVDQSTTARIGRDASNEVVVNTD